MKRIIASAACAALVACVSIAAHAHTIGYTQDTENYPNMLETTEGCSQAYDNYLAVAHPLNACRHLEEAKANLAAQKQIKSDVGAMKKCKECTKVGVQADEAAQAYKEQINLYSAQCPSKGKQNRLKNKLPAKTREVCRACKNKWPGTLGPTDGNPCK